MQQCTLQEASPRHILPALASVVERLRQVSGCLELKARPPKRQ